jgi:alkyldihydroxyacetonephosphate synthase
MQPRLKHFGWGREGEGLTPAEEAFVLGRIERLFGPLAEGKVNPPRLEDIKLSPPRLDPPPSLPFCSTALYQRAAHTYGKSFPDYVRGLVGDYSNAPDVVAYPRNEEEVVGCSTGRERRRRARRHSAADRASSAGLSHTAMRRGTRGR